MGLLETNSELLRTPGLVRVGLRKFDEGFKYIISENYIRSSQQFTKAITIRNTKIQLKKSL